MKRIGRFRREGGVYVGEISTLHLNVEARIVPASDKPFPNAPDYIVTQSRANGGALELGAAWLKHTRENHLPYMMVEIDDPVLPHVIRSVLCEGSDGMHHLYWDRQSAGEHVAEKLYVQEELKPPLGLARPIQNVTQRFRELFPTLVENN